MTNKTIFVFGSNLVGKHDKGSALEAVNKHGAIYGQEQGLQGNSYAIPTNDKHLRLLPLKKIQRYVKVFLLYAKTHPKLTFNVVNIGCSYAGYKPSEIAPFFLKHPSNVKLSQEFKIILKRMRDEKIKGSSA